MPAAPIAPLNVQVMLQLIFLTPLVMCGVMIVCWQPYSLKGKYLKDIKAKVQRINTGLPDESHII